MDTLEHMDLIRRAIAEVALVSYEGILGDDGEPIPHSDGFVHKLLLDRTCHHYGDAILGAFQRLGTIRRREREAQGKGSAISSDTASPLAP